MRQAITKIFATAAFCAVVFAGCEWTSSSSEDSWSDSYDNMNFSGTYRMGINVISSGDVGTPPSTPGTTNTYRSFSRTESVGSYNPARTAYSGKLHGGVVEGSVSITANGYIYTDNGSGVLVGNTAGAGNGTINYESGAWGFTINGAFSNSGTITAVYSFTEEVAGDSSSGNTPIGETPSASVASIKAITITQTGQHLRMMMSNGVTMEGRFGKVNQIAAGGYNAQFEVSSKNNRMVGTLDSSSGTRILDGTWVSGRNTFDVRGTGGAVSTSRSNMVE